MVPYATGVAEAHPTAALAHNNEGLDEVVEYLIGRGLAADCDKAARMLRALLELPGRYPKERVSVSRAAKALYVSRRALGRRCAIAGLPSPSHILAFGRVLNTLRLMRENEWTASRAAFASGWPDPFAFSNTMRHVTGLRPSAARGRGLIYLAEAWLQRELEEGNAELRSPRPPHCPSCGQEVRVRKEAADEDDSA